MKPPQFAYQHTSLTTLLEKQSYLDPKSVLNFTYGYPEGLNPGWITHYQTHPPENFLDVAPAVYISTIKSYFQNFFRATNVNLTPTCSLAFVIAAQALVQAPSDEIIMLDATYDSYPYIVQSFKGKVIYANRGANNMLDIEQIRKKYTPRAKAVVLCCPENPLGVIYSRDNFEQIIAFCLERNLTLVVDNCFAEVSPFGKEVPIVSHLKSSKNLSYILVADTGKILGLKGAKFGALIYSDNWGEALEAAQSSYFFQYNQYDLYLLSAILSDTRFPAYLARMNEQVAENYNYLKAHLDSKLEVLPIDGSCFCLVDVKGLGIDDVSYATLLMEKYAVIVIPMSYFYTKQRTFATTVRISLARSMDDIRNLAVLLNKSTATYR